jgi:hypothetical protein
VLLLDIRLGTDSGLRLLTETPPDQPRPAIIVLTSYDYPQYAEAALRLGASGLRPEDGADRGAPRRNPPGRGGRPGLLDSTTLRRRDRPPQRTGARRRPARRRRSVQRRDRRTPRDRPEDGRVASAPPLRTLRPRLAHRACNESPPRRLAGRAADRLSRPRR